jgi:hypothetical protein
MPLRVDETDDKKNVIRFRDEKHVWGKFEMEINWEIAMW